VKIAIASSSLLARVVIEALEHSQNEIVGFITMPDQPKGRSGSAKPNPFRELVSREWGSIPCFAPESDGDLQQVLQSLGPDLVVTLAYGRLIKEEALGIPLHGWLNIHFSKLPLWRGAAPVQRSLLAGERESGVTTFKIDRGMDTGPIYLQSSFTYAQDECATEALERMAEIGAKQLMDAIAMIEGGIAPIPQQGKSSNAPKIDKRELRLRLGSTSVELMAQIRAFTSQPGVWFLYRGQRMIISKARQSSIKVEEDHIKDEHGKLLVGTRDGSIEIEKITPEGKREMSGSEFLRGRDLRQAHPIE